MLAATCIALSVGVAAAAAERVLRLWRRPARDVWTAAMVTTLALPAAATILPRLPFATEMATVVATVLAGALGRPTTVGARFSPRPYELQPVVVRATDAPLVSAATLDALARLDRPLAIVWAALSLVVLAGIARGVRQLQRRRATWTAARVDGVRVLVADDVGPAVVGLRAPAIVLPRWALALETPLRALVVRHESEHVRAGDPRRLALGAVAVALVPWNVALWWQLRRLRVALEIDCDARVLGALAERGADGASPADVSRYGLLLLAVAQRPSTSLGHLAGAPALAESRSDLSRRIDAMRTPLPRRRGLRAAFGTCVAAAALGTTFAACTETRDAISPDRVAAARARDSAAAVATTLDRRAAARTWTDSLRIEIDGAVTQGDSFRVGMAAVRRALAHQADSVPPVRLPFELDASGGRGSRIGPASGPATLPGVKAALVQFRERQAALDARHPELETATTAYIRDRARANSPPKVVDANAPLFEYQVESAARPARGSAFPRYPEMLKAARVEGTVDAQFVVDQNGRVDMSTFRVSRSDHALFMQAVRAALETMRFEPATVGGRPVRQLIQQPFQFSLSR